MCVSQASGLASGGAILIFSVSVSVYDVRSMFTMAGIYPQRGWSSPAASCHPPAFVAPARTRRRGPEATQKPRMLAASKDKVLAELKQRSLCLRQLELEYYITRYTNIATQVRRESVSKHTW